MHFLSKAEKYTWNCGSGVSFWSTLSITKFGSISKEPTSLRRSITGLRSWPSWRAPWIEILLFPLPPRTILVKTKSTIKIHSLNKEHSCNSRKVRFIPLHKACVKSIGTLTCHYAIQHKAKNNPYVGMIRQHVTVSGKCEA